MKCEARLHPDERCSLNTVTGLMGKAGRKVPISTRTRASEAKLDRTREK